MFRNLGRETFLVPVIWEQDWPVFAPKTGHVELIEKAPRLPGKTYPEEPACDLFTAERELGPYWLLEHTFDPLPYSLDKGGLTLRRARLFRRLRSMHWRAELTVGTRTDGASLMLLADQKNWMRLGKQKGKLVLTVCDKGKEADVWESPGSSCELAVEGDKLDIQFFVKQNDAWKTAGELQDGRILSDYYSFTGNMVGMESTQEARFLSFSLVALH